MRNARFVLQSTLLALLVAGGCDCERLLAAKRRDAPPTSSAGVEAEVAPAPVVDLPRTAPVVPTMAEVPAPAVDVGRPPADAGGDRVETAAVSEAPVPPPAPAPTPSADPVADARERWKSRGGLPLNRVKPIRLPKGAFPQQHRPVIAIPPQAAEETGKQSM